MEMDVEAYLRRKYESQVADIEIMEKEDLDLVSCFLPTTVLQQADIFLNASICHHIRILLDFFINHFKYNQAFALESEDKVLIGPFAIKALH